MPLIKRAIPAATELASPQLYETSSNSGLLDAVGFANMTGVLHQLSQLAHYTTEIFDDLFTVSKELSGRLVRVNHRLSSINTALAHHHDHHHGANNSVGVKEEKHHYREEGR